MYSSPRLGQNNTGQTKRPADLPQPLQWEYSFPALPLRCIRKHSWRASPLAAYRPECQSNPKSLSPSITYEYHTAWSWTRSYSPSHEPALSSNSKSARYPRFRKEAPLFAPALWRPQYGPESRQSCCRKNTHPESNLSFLSQVLPFRPFSMFQSSLRFFYTAIQWHYR